MSSNTVLALFSGVVLLLAGCSSTNAPAAATTSERVAFRDPYTTAFELRNAKGILGYALRYDEVPLHASLEQSITAGSYRILGPDLKDLGFITPGGECFRHTTSGRCESLGVRPLTESLAAFFSSSEVTLHPLSPLKS